MTSAAPEMTPAEVLDWLARLEVEVWAEGERLRYRGPKLPPDVREILTRRKVELLAHLRQRDCETALSSVPRIVPHPEQRNEPFPLTDMQQAYWVGRTGAFQLGNVAAHFFLEADFPGLDIERLNSSLIALIERHDMLRAIVQPDGLQRILPVVAPYRMAVLNLSGRPNAEVEACLTGIRQEMSHQVFPTDRWPLFEIRASRMDGGLVRLHMGFDLLIGDVWSFQTFFRELFLLYRDPATALPPLELSFRDYVLAETAFHQSVRYRRSQDYWWGRLPEFPSAPELPLAVSPAKLERPRFNRRNGRLEPAAWRHLKERASKAGLTSTGALLAAFADVLAAWSGSPRFTLNVTFFNRLPFHPQINDIMGDFSATLLLTMDGAGETFELRAKRVQQQLWRDLEHVHVSGVRVLREMARMRRNSAAAAMPVVFTSALQTSREAEEPPWEEGWKPVYAVSQTPQVWLDHRVNEQAGALIYSWDVVEDLFPPGLMDGLFDAYCGLLEHLAASDNVWAASTPVQLSQGDLLVLAVAKATTAQLLPLEAAIGRGDTGLAEQLFARIARVLGVPRIDPETQPMDLGIVSMDMVQIVNWIEKELGFRPQIEDFYRQTSCAALASLFAARSEATGSAPLLADSVWDSFELVLDSAERQAFKQREPGLRRSEKGALVLELPPTKNNERLLRRRTHRHFRPEPVPLVALAGLLATLSRTTNAGEPRYLYPSAGGLYPVQTYVHVQANRVVGVGIGTYFYDPAGHRLVSLELGAKIDRAVHTELTNRPVFDQAAFSLFLVAEAAASAPLTGRAGRDLSLIEAGTMLQLLMVEADRLGLGLCPVDSLDFAPIRPLLRLGRTHEFLHTVLGGLPAA